MTVAVRTSVVIPAQGLRKAGLNVTVDLPIEARVNRPGLIVAAVLTGAGGLFMVGAGLSLLLLSGWPITWSGFALSLLCLVFGLPIMAMAVTCVRDLAIPGPVLIVDGEGFSDCRLSGQRILWREIVAARSLVAANGGIRFSLRGPHITRISRFRLGTFGLAFMPNPLRPYLSIRFLTMSPRAIEGLVLTLAREHGAVVSARNGYGFETPVNIVPQS